MKGRFNPLQTAARLINFCPGPVTLKAPTERATARSREQKEEEEFLELFSLL
jgi:hypothetical protein